VDVDATLDAPCPAAALFHWVEDLSRYPAWLGIVTRADIDGDGAWSVDLRGRVGPLARSKRLRMQRTALEAEHLAVFERAERDGRNHSPWMLRASVTPSGGGSHLDMHLHYGGGLWGPVLERMLRDEIDRSRARLLDLVSERTR
jgi:Polyketide cyclase / dehydrase and lipid transport